MGKGETNLLSAFLVNYGPVILEILTTFGLDALLLCEEPALILLSLRDAFADPLEKEEKLVSQISIG
jgi:hypothetical protein